MRNKRGEEKEKAGRNNGLGDKRERKEVKNGGRKRKKESKKRERMAVLTNEFTGNTKIQGVRSDGCGSQQWVVCCGSRDCSTRVTSIV